MVAKIKRENRPLDIVLLDRAPKHAAAFAELQPRIVSSLGDLRQAVTQASNDSVWISFSRDLTDRLVKLATTIPSRLGIGVFVHSLELKSVPVLSNLFRRIAFAADGDFISADELAEVLSASNRENLFIGGFVNANAESITFWRGDLTSLTAPFSAFARSGKGARPDFTKLAIIDCGQTVQLGDYEAAVSAILYEFDPAYRRTISMRRQLEDRSFGAALRRLRKQRGLRREDFEPAVAAKTIARIEQGKVNRIQKSTLQSLSARLGVEPQEIASY